MTSPRPEPNIAYVTFLTALGQTPCSIEQRLAWLQDLLDLDIELHLFVDDVYKHKLSTLSIGPRTQVHPLYLEDFETVRRIEAAAPHLRLPPYRNKQKDTFDFLKLMNCKPELLLRAVPFVTAPYIAYIDAGLSKVFKSETKSQTLDAIETLRVKDVPTILMPGCHPIRSFPSIHPLLTEQVNWTLCGGFYIQPTNRVEAFYTLHLETLQHFLKNGSLTWEVNVWAALAAPMAQRGDFAWYRADHNDSMITGVPAAFLA